MKTQNNNATSWWRLVFVVAFTTIVACLIGTEGLNRFVEAFSTKDNEWILAVIGIMILCILGYVIACWILAPTRKAKKDGSTTLITAVLIASFIALTMQECRAEGSIVVATAIPEGYVPLDSVDNPTLVEQVKTAVAQGRSEVIPTAVAQPDCSLQVVVVIVVIGGIIYISYKLIQACRNINKRRNKQIEKEDGDDSGSNTNHTRSAYGRLSLPEGSVVYCASFMIPNGSPTLADTNTCDCRPLLGLRFTVDNGQPALTGYTPTNTVDLETFLADHGLDTNGFVSVSYSYNGVPTNYLSEISLDPETKSIAINLPGFKNAQPVTFEQTTDLRTWTANSTITAPVGAKIKADFGSAEGTRFWRLKATSP